MFNYLLCRDRAVCFPLPAVCAGLCYWLIESVFCAAALPQRLLLAHTHTVAGQMRIHPAICPRETLPRPLLVPLPLSHSSLFYSLCLIFIPSFILPPLSFHTPTPLPHPFPIYSILPSHFNCFDPPVSLSVHHLFISTALVTPAFFLLPASPA